MKLDIETSNGHVEDIGSETIDILPWQNVEQRPTGEELDQTRKNQLAYNYLCRLEEARIWVSSCIKYQLPKVTEGMEESCRNGVVLAKLAKFVVPDIKFKIYDEDLSHYNDSGLNFRHTDNINAFRRSLERIKLPSIFYPETTDVYDMKNMPKLCYCIHALSLHMFKMGLAPQIHDLEGLLKFTEEEITAMQEALDKYNIQLPVFSKIGGLLTSEISFDEAALHAAILAINKALDSTEPADLQEKILNLEAHLEDINIERIGIYHATLLQEKEKKIMAGLNKNPDLDLSDVDISFKIMETNGDVYAVNLTQFEIQGHVKQMNKKIALLNFHNALKGTDADLLDESVTELNIKNYRKCHVNLYREFQADIDEDSDEIEQIEDMINSANAVGDLQNAKEKNIRGIKEAIKTKDQVKLLDYLTQPSALLPTITKARGDIYLSELESFEELTSETLFDNIGAISSIAFINQNLDNEDYEGLLGAMHGLEVDSIDEGNKILYYEALIAVHQEQNDITQYVDLETIQQTVHRVNMQHDYYQSQLAAVQRVNEAVMNCGEETVYETLNDSILNLSDIQEVHTPRYVALMQKHLENHEELWLQAIYECIELCHQQFEIMKKKCSAVVAINLLLLDDDIDEEQLLEMLQTDVLEYNIIPDCLPAYINALLEANNDINCDDNGWITEVVHDDNSTFYFDTNNFSGFWVLPVQHITVEPQLFLSSSNIKDCIDHCTQAYNKVEQWKQNEGFLIKLQSLVRMFIVRKRYEKRLQYLNAQHYPATIIQAYYRGYQVRHEVYARKQLWAESIREIIKIQSWFRMQLTRARYIQQLKHYTDNVIYIIRIQSWWRGCYVRNDYQGLTSSTTRLSAVKHFVHLLDKTSHDISEEEDICNLKKNIIRKIRDNEDLEAGLTSMDVKIGLLVKNRISLEEAEIHLRKLKTQKSVIVNGTTTLGRFNKDTQALIKKYESLFTLLQTDPVYLSKLLFSMNVLTSNKFMQSAVFAIFDWAQNIREEYLLLKLFRAALQEEIDQKVTKSNDLMTSNSLIIKLIVNFHRGIGMSFQGSNSEQTGKKSLRDILNARVKYVDQQSVTLLSNLEWNPRSIYQSIIQKEETDTGIKSARDHNATVEECLQNNDVKDILGKNLNTLSLLVEGFLDAIVSSVSALPYGLRYLAKCLFESLKEKFPSEREEILLLNVGNLIYYRFINPAIIAPDGFDVIDLNPGEILKTETRRCLGRIARCLQSAAAGSSEASALPSYLAQFEKIQEDNLKYSKRLQTFFRAVINVQDPNKRYGVNEYSEATEIQKPQIILNIKDILLTHEYCRMHEERIAPHHNDPLHEILADLGDRIPEAEQLLGTDLVHYDKEKGHNMILTLHPSTHLSHEEIKQAELNRLIHETKRLVCACCRVHTARSIAELIAENAPKELDQKYVEMFHRKMSDDRSKINENLKILKSENVISLDDEIINLIALDIRDQRRLRVERKLEFAKLTNTLDRLDAKFEYYQQQARYYESYIADCLQKQTARERKVKSKGARSSWRGKSSSDGIKYTAADLMKKEVLIEVRGVEMKSPYKGLQFSIIPIENLSGQWNVCARYMGVNALTTRIVLQDLLQKQYEGLTFVVLDGKAKVNVNLLLHLLNKKFHTSSLK